MARTKRTKAYLSKGLRDLLYLAFGTREILQKHGMAPCGSKVE